MKIKTINEIFYGIDESDEIEYLGHKFVIRIHGTNLRICKTCKLKAYIEYKNLYVVECLVVDNLTGWHKELNFNCDEMIIKNIIE